MNEHSHLKVQLPQLLPCVFIVCIHIQVLAYRIDGSCCVILRKLQGSLQAQEKLKISN